MQYEYFAVEIVDTLGDEFVIKTIKVKIPIKEQKQNIADFLPNNAGVISIKECSEDTVIDERIRYIDPMAGGFDIETKNIEKKKQKYIPWGTGDPKLQY